MPIRSVCVYCSSSDLIDPRFRETARELGAELGRRRLRLVYGGGGVGLMGELAQSARRHGASIVGVIPHFMKERELAFEEADELIVTATMRERKQRMEEVADAFLILPGGFGTLEEAMEIITLKLLERHDKPVVFFNQDQFFAPLFSLFEHLIEKKFARAHYRALYHAASGLAEAFSYFETYRAERANIPWHVTG